MLINLLRQIVLVLVFVIAGCSINSGNSTNWEFLGNSPDMQHHSNLDQINDENVNELELMWAVDIPTLDGMVGNPLVKNGIIFQSGSLGRVFAHDIRTGDLLWKFEPKFDFTKMSLTSLWAARFNRGVALNRDNVIVATGDCRIVALNQVSGSVQWEYESCDPTQMYGITAAPRVSEDMVFTGNTCVDSGMTRGYVDGIDSHTGKRKWRFYTVPGHISNKPKNKFEEMVADSWGTNGVPEMRGCGSVWDAMTYDKELNLLYIGVAGPAPLNPQKRAKDAGDELFTNSIVALNADTGEYVWHFKQVPHDGWNFDSSVGIMAATVSVEGQDRRVVISVPKSGFVYLLDANTGEFLSGEKYMPINWASGLDENGRPIFLDDAKYWQTDNNEAIVAPGVIGSHSWEALALNPHSELLYIPASSQPAKYKTLPNAVVGGTSFDFYYGSRGDKNWTSYGEIIAWDLIDRKAKWRHRTKLPMNSGLLHTDGNLLFQGTADGMLNIFNAENGNVLWSRFVGGAIRGAPTTVMVDGDQVLLVPTGNGNSAATGPLVARYASTPNTRSKSRLLAFKLGASGVMPEGSVELDLPAPLITIDSDDEKISEGQMLYEASACAECHGQEVVAARGSAPDLRVSISYLTPDMFSDIVINGARLNRGMPKFDFLSKAQANSIYAYIVHESIRGQSDPKLAR